MFESRATQNLRAFISRQLDYMLNQGQEPKVALQMLQRSVDSASLAMVKTFARELRSGNALGLFGLADPVYRKLRHVLVASSGNVAKLTAAFGCGCADVQYSSKQYRHVFLNAYRRCLYWFVFVVLVAWLAKTFSLPLLTYHQGEVGAVLGDWAIWLLNPRLLIQLLGAEAVLLLVTFLIFNRFNHYAKSLAPMPSGGLKELFGVVGLIESYHGFLMTVYVDVLRRSELSADMALGQAVALIHNIQGAGGQASALEKVAVKNNETIVFLTAALKLQSLDRELPYQTDIGRVEFTENMQTFIHRLMWPPRLLIGISLLVGIVSLVLPFFMATIQLLE